MKSLLDGAGGGWWRSVVSCYVMIMLALYVAVASYRIGYPGVFYDELLWGNAALGGVDDSFIILRIFDVPVMLMSYIGALKSWLYYPLFKLFGVSPHSIRIPMIIASALALYVTYRITARMFDTTVAAIVLALLAIDASFVSQTRVDQGPIILALVISTGCLYFFTKLLEEFKTIYLWAIFFLALAGMFNKLNFIWFVNAFFGSALLMYGSQIRRQVRERFRGWRVTAVYVLIPAGYLLLVCYFLALNHAFGLLGSSGSASLPARVSFVASELVLPQLRGDAFFNYALGDLNHPLSSFYIWFFLLVMASGLGCALFGNGERGATEKRSLLFILVMVAILLVQVICTSKATAYWHVFVLYPFITMLFGYAIVTLARYLGRVPRPRLMLLTFFLGVTVSYQIFMNWQYLAYYGEAEKNPHWSSAIYDLIDYADSTKDTFVSVDWGTHSQLVTFTGRHGKFIEICYWLEQLETLQGKYGNAAGILGNPIFTLIQETNSRPLETYRLLTSSGLAGQKEWLTRDAMNPGGGHAFILHPEEFTEFRQARQNLFRMARERGVTLRLAKVIHDRQGRAIYEIYRPG